MSRKNRTNQGVVPGIDWRATMWTRQTRLESDDVTRQTRLESDDVTRQTRLQSDSATNRFGINMIKRY